MTIELDSTPRDSTATKAADLQTLTRGSLQTLSGYGSMGSKPQPFNYQASMASFHSWCFAAAMINAKAIAAVPLRLYVRSKPRPGMKRVAWSARPASRRVKMYLSGRADHRPSAHVVSKIAEWGDDGFEEVTEPHPILRLLSTFNPDVNGYEASILQLVYMQLCGTAYLMPVLDQTGVPTELWPLPSQHVKWIPARPGSGRMVDGFTYGVSSENMVRFEPDEVIPYRLTLDPRRPWFEGMGFVEAAWQALCLSRSKSEHDRAFYDNYARPDWLLTIKGDYGNEALDRFEAAVERKLQGTRRHGSFLTVPGDVTATALNLPTADVGDPARAIEVIAATFGVSVSRLMANQNVAGGQAEVGDKSHLRDTVLPICRAIEEKHNERLLTYWGIEDDAFLAYDDPVPENESLDVDLTIKRTNAGLMLINEARASDGLEPIRGGNVPRFNGVPLDSMVVPGLPSLPSLPPAQGRPTTAPDGQQPPTAVAPAPDAGTPQRSPNGRETQPTPADANPDPNKPQVGTVAEATLNGAQIAAALDVIARLSAGEIVAPVAIELLVAVGIPRERATVMADQTAAAAQRRPANDQRPVNDQRTDPDVQPDNDAKAAARDDRVDVSASRPDGGGAAADGPARSSDGSGGVVGKADHGRADAGAGGGDDAVGVDGGPAAGQADAVAESADGGSGPAPRRVVRAVGVIGQLDVHQHDGCECAVKAEQSHTPNDAMVEEAKRGLQWRDEFNRGGTEIGVARARDISNRRGLSLDTVRRMASYFARHEVDKQGQGWSPGEDGYPSAGRIAWALWGGDPGRSWASRILRSADAEKAKAAGDADDHARDGQPERPEDALAAGLRAVFGKQAEALVADLAAILRGLDLPDAKKIADGVEVKDDRATGVRLSEADIRKLERSIAERLAKFDDEIAAVARPPMTATFAAGHARGQADPAVAAAMQSAGRGAVAFDVTNPDVATFMENYTIKLAGRVNQTTTTNVAYSLADGFDNGEGLRDLAQRVKDEFAGASDERATLIARTESARAYSEGQKQGWADSEVVTGMKWLLASEACPVCKALADAFNDKVVPLDGAFLKVGDSLSLPGGGTFVVDYQDITAAPAHPNCLLPGTLISASGVVAAITARYNGPAVEITTASGRRLSVTANHKLLTRRGFASAHSLREGEYVISSHVGKREISTDPNYDDRPTLIENVVGAFAKAAGVSSVRVPTAAEYLHGDGRRCDGDIHVVASDRLLTDDRQTSPLKHGHQLPLCASWDAYALNGLRDADAVLVGLSLAAHGVVGGFSELESVGVAGVRHADHHRVTAIAWRVPGGDHAAGDGLAADTDAIGHYLDRFSALVTLDQIVNIRQFNYSGHVYDLQTVSGLYNGNGLYTSNCRCDIQAVTE